MTVVDERSAAPASSVTPARILNTPLADLLADLDVDVYASSIEDRSFFGAVVQRNGGQLALAMPTGRSDFEHDTIARYLLAQVFDVDLPDLAAPFVTSAL